MNLKQKCAECGRELVKGERTQKLMQGPRGYRKYDVCLKCAGVSAPSVRTQARPKAAKKAGAQ